MTLHCDELSWQPIATAPMDFDLLLIGESGVCFVACQDEDPNSTGYCWHGGFGRLHHRDAFTHWQHLPNGPATKIVSTREARVSPVGPPGTDGYDKPVDNPPSASEALNMVGIYHKRDDGTETDGKRTLYRESGEVIGRYAAWEVWQLLDDLKSEVA